MSDLNEILNALYKADLVIEEVDPDDQDDQDDDSAPSEYAFPEELRPLPGDSLGTLLWKRMLRAAWRPHMSTSYVLGDGVNLNDFLPPGFSMNYTTVTEFNQIVLTFPPLWWTSSNAEYYWTVFIAALFIYGVEYNIADAADIMEWLEWYISVNVNSEILMDDILARTSNFLMQTFGWSIIQANAYINGLWDGVTDWTEKAIAQAAGWTVQQAIAFMNGAWDGLSSWTRWIQGLTNALPIPMLPDFSKSKLVGEQTSSMARMKEKHRDENDRIRTKHEREIDAAQRRERNRQRTQRQG